VDLDRVVHVAGRVADHDHGRAAADVGQKRTDIYAPAQYDVTLAGQTDCVLARIHNWTQFLILPDHHVRSQCRSGHGGADYPEPSRVQAPQDVERRLFGTPKGKETA